jgi:hypothetical protein
MTSSATDSTRKAVLSCNGHSEFPQVFFWDTTFVTLFLACSDKMAQPKKVRINSSRVITAVFVGFCGVGACCDILLEIKLPMGLWWSLLHLTSFRSRLPCPAADFASRTWVRYRSL